MADEYVNIEEQEQVPAEEATQEEVASGVKIALTDGEGRKILADTIEGHEDAQVDGIYVTDGKNAFIVALTEQALPFGGDSQDLEEGDPLYDIASPSMSTFDGEWRTDFLISFFGYGEGTALVGSKEYGWLPSGGEMALIHSKKAEINELLEALEGTVISDGVYWTSQKFSNERVWSCMMDEGKFTLNYGNVDSLAVRPIMSAEGYAEEEEAQE